MWIDWILSIFPPVHCRAAACNYIVVFVGVYKMLLLKICQSVASRSWVLSPVQQHVRTRMMLFTSHCSAQWCRISTLQKSLLAKVSRSYSRGMPRLPLDAENLSAMITKDVTVFTYRNNRYFLMLSIFGGMQFLFWANLAIFIKSDPTTQNSGKADATLRKNYSSWMSKFYAENRTKIAATCFALGEQVFREFFRFSVVNMF